MLRLALAAALMAIIPDDMPIPPQIGGRADAELRFGWPGVYFEGRFRGTDVRVAVENGTDRFRVLVDGAERGRITEPGPQSLAVDGLSDGAHVVRLEKLTESISGSSRFAGFFTRSGQPLKPQPKARQIEFIGDSLTVGYGNLSSGTGCTGAEVHDRTDTQQAFGPLVARRLDADYRIFAASGFGVVRNYDGNFAGETLLSLYPRAYPDKVGTAAPDPNWRPQVIVVNLGTNDFSTALNPGERWAGPDALRADWRARYVAFVQELKASQPQARFVLMASDRFLADAAGVAEAVGAKLLPFRGLAMTGCNGHPSLADHRLLAGLVEEVVRPLF